MNKYELIELLYSSDEEEVFIEIDDTLYEIEIGHQEETFDGFDTVYPASLTLKPKNNNERHNV